MTMTKAVQAWRRVSPDKHVHVTGAQIERRGFPQAKPGWYLVPADPTQPAQRFAPTPEGCDEAFIAFTGQSAALDALTRLLTRD